MIVEIKPGESASKRGRHLCIAVLRQLDLLPFDIGDPRELDDLQSTEIASGVAARLFSVISDTVPDSRVRRSQKFTRRVESQIEGMLASGRISMDSVASGVGCSRATVYRRLRHENTGFQALVERVRRRRAMELICDQGATVKEAAYQVGFSDPATFSRAFKRWTGKTAKSLSPRGSV